MTAYLVVPPGEVGIWGVLAAGVLGVAAEEVEARVTEAVVVVVAAPLATVAGVAWVWTVGRCTITCCPVDVRTSMAVPGSWPPPGAASTRRGG